jgi:hypothetical protein
VQQNGRAFDPTFRDQLDETTTENIGVLFDGVNLTRTRVGPMGPTEMYSYGFKPQGGQLAHMFLTPERNPEKLLPVLRKLATAWFSGNIKDFESLGVEGMDLDKTALIGVMQSTMNALIPNARTPYAEIPKGVSTFFKTAGARLSASPQVFQGWLFGNVVGNLDPTLPGTGAIRLLIDNTLQSVYGTGYKDATFEKNSWGPVGNGEIPLGQAYTVSFMSHVVTGEGYELDYLRYMSAQNMPDVQSFSDLMAQTQARPIADVKITNPALYNQFWGALADMEQAVSVTQGPGVAELQGEKEAPKVDKAEVVGGIKLDSANMNMKIEFNGEGFQMKPEALAKFANINLDGIAPVLLGVRPFDMGQFAPAPSAK